MLQWEAYLLLFILHRAARENADTICHSFQKKLPKIASKLKTLKLYVVTITHQCVNGITQLLDSSLREIEFDQCPFSIIDFNDLITSVSKSNLKYLTFFDRRFNRTNAELLATLLTQNSTLERITITSERNQNIIFMMPFSPIHCDAARLLVEAMTTTHSHSHIERNTLLLQVCVEKSCKQTLTKIPYSRDRVDMSCIYRL